MGYIIVLVVGVVLLVVITMAFMGGRRGGAGRTKPHHDITPKQPEAETLNPAASDTATQKEANAAQRHTPPA